MKSFSLTLFLCAAAISAIPLEPKRIRAGGRIIDGKIAEDRQFPWQVAVYFDTPEGSFFCGGSLIHHEWVLTSGHCSNRATRFTLHLGSNELVAEDPHRVTITSTHSRVHPAFANNSLDNDIGLIHLDQPLVFTEYINPISFISDHIEADEEVIISGWGASGDWNGVEVKLHYTTLKTISNEDCKNVYGDAVINDDMICSVGSRYQGPCGGDNGGALVYFDDRFTQAVQIGISSFVSSAGCTTRDPSGYTRTGNYIEWIQSVISTGP